MKPDQPLTSTTNTLFQRKPAGSQAALTVSITAVALAAHALMHVSLAGTVAVVAVLKYQEFLGLLFGLLIAMAGVLYAPLKSKDPSDYLTRGLANITNAIAGQPLIPECIDQRMPPNDLEADGRPPHMARRLDVLPPATNAARTEDEPVYWGFVHDNLKSAGRPDILTEPAMGRHARRRTSVSTDADWADADWTGADCWQVPAEGSLSPATSGA